jgi:hypothetical protein
MANYDPTRNDLGYVRLLISDTQDGDGRVFTDDEVGEILTREGNVKLAASVLLLIIAGNEALVAKVIRTQDLQTDGAKLSAELRALSNVYREQGKADVLLESADTAPIVIPWDDGHYDWPELADYKTGVLPW